MIFCIADSFQAALRRLSAQEQKAVKETVFDLQMNPAAPGLQFHRIDKSKDSNFWSMRVSRDIRLIVHKTEGSFLVCYVDHHDDAYAWAERRRIETHPKTGAAQIVEVRERVQEIVVHRPVVREQAVSPVRLVQSPLFAGITDEELLTYGVPVDWLSDVKAATEDTLFDIAEHLPREAAEALLDLATGTKPQVAPATAPELVSPFEHPDAQRRFRVMDDVEELKRALEFPWDQWTVFLHPSQRQVVDQAFSGPARVSGSAGTGKTVVALHRAANILRQHRQARLLLTTFSLPLANALEGKLRILAGEDKGVVHRVTVLPFKGVAHDLFTLAFGHHPRAATEGQIRAALEAAADASLTSFTPRFLASEWLNVVDAWQLASLDAYQTVPRLGRKNRLGAKQREKLWPVFVRARQLIEAQGLLTWPSIFGKVTAHFAPRADKPFTHAVIDEAQDLGVPELRMLAAITPAGPDALFFAGDLGQRIFQEPFSWKGAGSRYPGTLAHPQGQLQDLAPDPAGGRSTSAADRAGRRRQ